MGNLVYDNLGINETWKGRVNGNDLAVGVYSRIAKITFVDGISKSYAGDVSLVR